MVKLVLLSVTIISIVLGSFVYLRNSKERSSIYYSIFSFFVALWAFGMWMYAKDPPDYNRVLIWSRILHFAGIGVSAFVFLFSLTFIRSKITTRSTIFLALAPGLIMSFIALFSGSVIELVNFLPGNRQLLYGNFYPLYFIVFSLYIISALGLLFYSFLHAKGLYKQQLKYISIGILIPSLCAFVINMVLPAFGNFRIAWAGPIFMFIENVCIAYAITKFRAFNVRALFSEIWALFLAVLVIIWLVSNFTWTNFAFFLVIFASALLLVRSVMTEAKQKTQIEDLAKDLKHANEHLEELDKLKDNFMSMASHELNTPIAAIEGYLSMILDEGMGGEIPEKAKKYLDSVYQSSKRLAALVKDLLNVSRIESNRVHLIYAQVQMEALLDQAIMEVGSKVSEVGHTLIFERPSHPLPQTWIDKDRVTEVIVNFLGNAIKYTQNGGKIVVRTWRQGNELVVSVEDNGKGIPPEKKDRVFQKFTQVDVLKDEVKGTGLGMYISKNLIELHKGRIWFKSDGDGKGSTFYFSVPILAEKPFDPHENEGAVLQLK